MSFIRVGDDFFRFIDINLDGIKEKKMLPIKRQTLVDDYGKEFLRSIPKFDTFVNIPDNIGSIKVPANLFNLYEYPDHTPKRGEWKWTKILLKHIFGDQYELGLDYVQLIYTKPKQMLPILSLVSKENQTGKTTFLNWLGMIFKSNFIIIGNQELSSDFNFMFAHRLIIAIEESRVERSVVQEKIKAMATQKKAILNEKFQRTHSVDFYGKLIMASNHEDNFVSASKEDIRYWVRKVPVIPDQFKNYDIEEDLNDEVPAFLHFILNRELSTKKLSRAWFDIGIIETDALNNVREHSHTPMYFDLFSSFVEFFAKNPEKEEVKATTKQIIDNLLPKNNQYNSKYLTKVLRDEFEMQSTFGRFEEVSFNWMMQPGYYYVFKREMFMKNEEKNTQIAQTVPF